MEPFKAMENTVTSNSNKESKSTQLNNIVNTLMEKCDSCEAVIIADWQGLSFASKLPKDINEDEVSATTLFMLEGAEGTRKELEKSLVGDKLSYLMMVSEKDGKTAYMFVFPIGTVGYIASISYAREDMALIVQNMKIAANKSLEILQSTQETESRSIDSQIAPKYKNLLQKLEALKDVKLTFLETSPSSSSIDLSSSVIPPNPPPTVCGPLPPPEIPLEFLEVETEIEPLEPEIIIPSNLIKYQVVFIDSKGIRYTVNIQAVDELDAEVRLQNMQQYHPIQIQYIKQIEPLPIEKVDENNT